MDLREVGYDDRDWINLAQDRDRWRAYPVPSTGLPRYISEAPRLKSLPASIFGELPATFYALLRYMRCDTSHLKHQAGRRLRTVDSLPIESKRGRVHPNVSESSCSFPWQALLRLF
ncbi:hypothetical protein ANN_08971 [Periplaneta americana]|uniref:Uncharacterized protein n=1 Tax=Periplaneta americana TaxID=6978 RepID=A0ABQ8T4C5_PERAM|nr:hypothetical protein ANN_08971 [Periplaneta americana]